MVQLKIPSNFALLHKIINVDSWHCMNVDVPSSNDPTVVENQNYGAPVKNNQINLDEGLKN